MLIAGVVGILCVLALLGAYWVVGKSFAWEYSEPGPVVLWDKLFILLLSLLSLSLSYTRFGPRWGRLLIAILALAASAAVLLDDVANGNIAFSTAWMSLVMLVAVSMMPYQPWQAFISGIVLLGLYLLCLQSLPASSVIGGVEYNTARFVFLIIVTFLCAGISAFQYNSRYEQYRAHRKTRLLREHVTEQAEKLVEMDRLKARFFANISHEFRTPLTLILGPLESFLSHPEPSFEAEARPQLELMHRNAHRLLQLINQLLDLSKLEAGSMQFRAHRGNIVRYLQGLMHAFASYAERKKIDLQFHPAREEIHLYFDADKVEKILFNLLSNAFKFTPEGGTIRVRVTETGREEAGTVEISVKDTGSGIPADQVAFVFDRFHQVEGAAGHARGGTGIGLALVKELVDLHGGTIRVESEPGFGSEFMVTLRKGRAHLRHDQIEEGRAGTEGHARPPFALYRPAPSEVAPAAPTPPAGAVPDEGDTVLVVDDHADVRGYVRDCLGKAYHVVEARDGQEGLEQAREHVPDLIIADVMMPRMDGFALCWAVKADTVLNHIPVILLTARATDESKVEGLETGADDYLFKPFSADELRVRVRNLITLRRKLRARFSRDVLIEPSVIAVKSADEMFIEQACGVVEAHMADDAFSVEAFADAMSMGSRQLQRKLRALTDQTPTVFIRLLRLKRAAQLLEQQAGTVSEIAYAVGFNNPTYFATRFREVFGVPPSEYRAAP